MGTPIRHLTEDTSPAAGDMLVVDKAAVQTTRKWTLATLVSYLQATLVFGSGSGEINTASNVSTSGVGAYDSKSGVDLRFRKINGASSKLTATLNSQQIDLDVVDASTSQKGAVQLAGIDGTDATAGKAVQASDARLAAATTSNRGTVLLAAPSSDVTAGHVVQASDTRLSDARTPTSHVHNASDVNAGTLAAARLPAATTSAQGAAILATPSSDVTAGHVVQASDTRLSDSRVPSGTAGGDLGGTYPNPTISVRTVAQGGTGATTLAAHGVVVGNGASAVNVTGAGTAGQVLTSNGASADPTFQAAGSVVITAYKSADQSVASSTTFVTDNHLTVSLATSGIYKVEFLVHIEADVANGFKWGRTGTATYTNEDWSYLGIDQDGNVTFAGLGFSGGSFAGFTSLILRISGTVEVNAGGTLVIQWAQAVSGAVSTTMKRGGSIVATKM